MIHIKVTDQVLIPATCIDLVADPSAGGTTTFIGTVRNQTKGRQVFALGFEAYVPMAEKEMKKIAEHIVVHWHALHVCIFHRTGRLSIGEIPVVIAVSTPHRNAAFEACQYAIDTLKETVPIWKKEMLEDGEVWVSAHP
jgi:molybdopterin synthase catalytic subunit